MVKKQVKFDPENIERLGNKGTSRDTLDDAFRKLLDQDDDIDRCLEGGEPQTEKLQKLKRRWCK
jgi:hypothetical protein